jgi:hypothetical protein
MNSLKSILSKIRRCSEEELMAHWHNDDAIACIETTTNAMRRQQFELLTEKLP